MGYIRKAILWRPFPRPVGLKTALERQLASQRFVKRENCPFLGALFTHQVYSPEFAGNQIRVRIHFEDIIWDSSPMVDGTVAIPDALRRVLESHKLLDAFVIHHVQCLYLRLRAHCPGRHENAEIESRSPLFSRLARCATKAHIVVDDRDTDSVVW